MTLIDTVQHRPAVAEGLSFRLPLLLPAASSFGIGTTEYVVTSLLPDVTTDVGVSIPRAGLLVTGCALSVAFGSPFLAIATAAVVSMSVSEALSDDGSVTGRGIPLRRGVIMG